MLELIARLEAATEGSRELDRAVIEAIYPDWVFRIEPATPALLLDARLMAKTPCGIEEHVRLDHYTTSLDAALTLVPEGWFLDGLAECVMPIHFAGQKHEPTGYFQAALQWRDGGGRQKRANGRTPALALCIAALRTRLAQP